MKQRLSLFVFHKLLSANSGNHFLFCARLLTSLLHQTTPPLGTLMASSSSFSTSSDSRRPILDREVVPMGKRAPPNALPRPLVSPRLLRRFLDQTLVRRTLFLPLGRGKTPNHWWGTLDPPPCRRELKIPR